MKVFMKITHINSKQDFFNDFLKKEKEKEN